MKNVIQTILILFFLILIREMNAQVVFDKLEYVSDDSTVIVYADSTSDHEFWYYNNKLGIRFKYFEAYNPVSHIMTPLHDLSKWNNYKNDDFKVQFKYPSEFTMKISQEDSTIRLGYYLTRHVIERDYSSDPDTNDYGEHKIIKDSTYEAFESIVSIYITDMTFNEIAEYEGFERGRPYTDKQETVINDNNGGPWIIRGKGGMSNEAYYLDGLKWKGLRGESYTGLSHSGGEYVFAVPSLTLFICQQLSNGKFLVFSFYDGPTGEVEDESKFIINEDDFYNIVNSVVLIQ